MSDNNDENVNKLVRINEAEDSLKALIVTYSNRIRKNTSYAVVTTIAMLLNIFSPFFLENTKPVIMIPLSFILGALLGRLISKIRFLHIHQKENKKLYEELIGAKTERTTELLDMARLLKDMENNSLPDIVYQSE